MKEGDQGFKCFNPLWIFEHDRNPLRFLMRFSRFKGIEYLTANGRMAPATLSFDWREPNRTGQRRSGGE
jgi:hypothetical protein